VLIRGELLPAGTVVNHKIRAETDWGNIRTWLFVRGGGVVKKLNPPHYQETLSDWDIRNTLNMWEEERIVKIPLTYIHSLAGRSNTADQIGGD